MSRYTDGTAVRLALRAPSEASAASWSDGTYDALIDSSIEEAELSIDAMCPAWAPFDAGTVTEERKFTARGEAVYGILETDPFVLLPSDVEDGEVKVDSWGAKITNYRAYIPVRSSYSGRSLVGPFIEDTTYSVYTQWGHSKIPEGVRIAATKIAARSFGAVRTAMNQGIVETSSGAMYEPRYDAHVRRWLSRWLSP